MQAANGREIFGWPAMYSFSPHCQVSMIVPMSMNGDLAADQAVPCIAAATYNTTQPPGFAGAYVQPVLADVVPDPSQPPGPLPAGLNTSTSVQRVARPILGAASNLSLSQGNLDSTSGKAVGAIVPVTVDVPAPARPPSNSDSVPNGRHWPPLGLDSPNGMRSAAVPPPPSSSPIMLQQPLPADTAVTANPSHQLMASPYCFIAPAVVPATTVPSSVTASTSTAVAPAAGTPSPTANLCTAGCCHCGQCQAPAPRVGYTYAYPPFMVPNAAPFLPGFGYAIPGLPYPPPTMPPVSYGGAYTHTQSSEVVYNSQQVVTFMHQFQRPPPPPPHAPVPPPAAAGCGGLPPLKPSPVVTVPFNPLMPPPPPAHIAANPTGRRKNMSCFNCGLIGHQASMCPEPQISSSAHTGTNWSSS